MSAISPSPPASRATRTVAPVGPMLWRQTTSELLKLWRTPAFSIASLALPALFFAFFGLPNLHSTEAGISAGRYILASFGAYGVVSVMLFSFGVSIAVERGQRMNVLMRATPLRSWVYLLAKVVPAHIFSFLMLVILFTFGALAGGIRMDLTMWTVLTLRLLLGALPFIALGFAIGLLAGPTSAAPITNILFLVLSFASGLFLPISLLPKFVQQLAPYLPTYHLGELVWSAVGAQVADSLGANVLWLVGYGIMFVLAAVWAYSREERKTFG